MNQQMQLISPYGPTYLLHEKIYTPIKKLLDTGSYNGDTAHYAISRVLGKFDELHNETDPIHPEINAAHEHGRWEAGKTPYNNTKACIFEWKDVKDKKVKFVIESLARLRDLTTDVEAVADGARLGPTLESALSFSALQDCGCRDLSLFVKELTLSKTEGVCILSLLFASGIVLLDQATSFIIGVKSGPPGRFLESALNFYSIVAHKDLPAFNLADLDLCAQATSGYCYVNNSIDLTKDVTEMLVGSNIPRRLDVPAQADVYEQLESSLGEQFQHRKVAGPIEYTSFGRGKDTAAQRVVFDKVFELLDHNREAVELWAVQHTFNRDWQLEAATRGHSRDYYLKRAQEKADKRAKRAKTDANSCT